MEIDKWFKIDPVPEEDMALVGGRYTICEVLREIYRSIEDSEIKMKCRIASSMAKSMAARITKYEGRNWGKLQYPLNPHKKDIEI